MSSDRPRPPSVRAAARRGPAARRGRDRSDALAAVAREVVADERARLAAGEPPADVERLADEVARPARGFADPAGSGLTSRSSTRPASSSTPTSAARRGRPRRSRRRQARRGRLLAARVRPRRRAAAGRASAPRRTHLIALTGAEDALVTINNAAALALAVGLAGRRGVAVSRGELVEIGGGVRIPEIVRRAGARLVEVGTTNRTRAADFEAPAGRRPGDRRGPARPPVELRPDRVRRGARSGRGRARRPRARGDRRRRPRQRRAARHGALRPRPRADAARAAGGRARTS